MDMMVLNIGSNTPSIEIVKNLLSRHKITDDINLFYLAITKPNKGKYLTSTSLGRNDSELILITM